jgi:two-component system, NtrC family, response regulator HydG
MDAQPTRLLVIDADRTLLTLIGGIALGEGFEVATAADVCEALSQLRSRPADLVLLDVGQPDGSDLDGLRAIRDVNGHCAVVLTTGAGALNDPLEAVRLGAADILSKPFDLARLRAVLRSIRSEAARRRAVLQLEQQVAQQLEFCGMIGRGAPMQHVFGLIRRFANHAATVLVTGETGTGKELVARALHQLGPRSSSRLTVINCIGLTEPAFEAADGGTLFLDEVAALPLAMQGTLLRVLETGEVERRNSGHVRKIDVRVIAATARDLALEVEAGRFSADLYYRLHLVHIALPPLRARREDIPYLTAAFVRGFAHRFGKRLVGLTQSAERMLHEASWDGNVRQLRSVLERACIMADGDFVAEPDIAGVLREQRIGVSVTAHLVTAAADTSPLETVERDHIIRTLQRVRGNKAVAARLLGVSRRAFYRQLERHGLHQRIPAAPPPPAADILSMEQV